MVILLRYIFGLFTSISIVVAGGGFGFYQHHCSYDVTKNSSISIQSDNCDQNESIDSCTEKEANLATSCCSLTETAENNQKHDCSYGTSCCTTEYIYFKTDIFDAVKSPKKEFNLISSCISKNEINNEEPTAYENLHFCIRHNLPPPKFGKELLVFTHHLKIAHSIV